MKSPEVSENCSTGFHFPCQSEETIQVCFRFLRTLFSSEYSTCFLLILGRSCLIIGKGETPEIAAFL